MQLPSVVDGLERRFPIQQVAYHVKPLLVQHADVTINCLLPDANSELAVPLVVAGKLYGVINVYAKRPFLLNHDHLNIMSMLGDQVAVAWQNALLYIKEKEAVVELEALDRLKSRFLATMSHELRTPLNSILGFAEIIMTEGEGDLTEKIQSDLQTIYRNGEYLLMLINDILDMAKIEAEQLFLDKHPVDINMLIIDVIQTLRPLSEKKKLHVDYQFMTQPVSVYGDMYRLRQVFINIIGNAIKFTEAGRVQIVTSIQQTHARIQVKDSGLGVPPQHLEKIFNSFYRLDNDRHRKVGGTGLGLPISKRLVEMHDGEIWAESSGVAGEGTAVIIKIPLLIDQTLNLPKG